MVIVDEVGIPLAGLAAKKAVEALEPAAKRPAPLPRRYVGLLARREVPLADGVRVPAALVQDLGDRAVLKRDPSRKAREPGRGLSDARHVVARGITPVEQARARRRAQRGCVEVGVADAPVGDPLHVRRLDRAAKHVHRAVADVVPHDHKHVRCALRGLWLQEWLPVWSRVPDIDVNYSIERLAPYDSFPGSVTTGLCVADAPLRPRRRGSNVRPPV